MKVVQGGQLVRVGITFPSHYPNKAAPSFMFDKSTTISIANQQELNRVSYTGTDLTNQCLRVSNIVSLSDHP